MSAPHAVDRIKSWLIGEALPFWGREGFDEGAGCFIERADFSGRPLVNMPRRTMVQGRQIYVFAHAALLGWWPQGRALALKAADRMIDDRFVADDAPGWVFSLSSNGAVHDGRRDLYTQAFALFGLAFAYRLAPVPRYLAAARATLDGLDRHFAAPTGGYVSSLPGDPHHRHQNPHMHVFEALIAWYETTGEPAFLARAGELHGMMEGRFFQSSTGILAEYFDGSWVPEAGLRGRICEPGHHYEWSWLLRNYARKVRRERSVVADRLKTFADLHGYDDAGLVVDEVLDDGSVHKPSRRCWPHTEAIKAEVAAFEAGDPTAEGRAVALIDQLMRVFLGRPFAGGWIDHVDADGAPIVDFVPASSLYHVFLAVAEASRVWSAPAHG